MDDDLLLPVAVVPNHHRLCLPFCTSLPCRANHQPVRPAAWRSITVTTTLPPHCLAITPSYHTPPPHTHPTHTHGPTPHLATLPRLVLYRCSCLPYHTTTFLHFGESHYHSPTPSLLQFTASLPVPCTPCLLLQTPFPWCPHCTLLHTHPIPCPTLATCLV